MPEPVLTARQRQFVIEFLKDFNATQAAIRAGYSAKTATKNAARLMVVEGIRQAIIAKQRPRLEAAELTAERTLEEMRRVAFSDAVGCFSVDGNLLHIKDMPPEVRAQVAQIEVIKKNLVSGDGFTDTIYKVKFWDKVKALDLLARHFALLTDQVKVKVEHDIQNMTTEELKALARELGGE